MTTDRSAARDGRGPVARALLAAVGFYQRAISPNLPPRCRFQPTCSDYAVEALTVHGAGRGSLLALWRLLRCAPWHPGGLDLVPPARTSPPGSARPVPPAPHRGPQQEAGVA
ncbi:membrane protein insertion efficiency factor YidD [Geodermatophilus sp. DSM 44513]|uniref:membrane protein insertion efficiency factor YidD n=1 Tax=Geodermatophilus sp. DSM 44513 TaxID=1528104 RepID=UPI00128575DA|nr:membrane protein insertion efficiency factor YidD [Geodermatophilus sp. DSM 44513]WNV75676.1 membrane protein insertion efficiency factor YidD [Geodermatophilus sp. DSM 44513]